MYTFHAINDKSVLKGTSKLKNIIDGFPQDYNKQCALIQGKLKNLFGNPFYETLDLENQYSYIIQATDKNGNNCYLDVYCGPSGPAIGGIGSVEGIMDAALQLIREIQMAAPSDFHYEGYYPDTLSKISTGVKDGAAYYNEETMTDPDEIKRMFDSI